MTFQPGPQHLVPTDLVVANFLAGSAQDALSIYRAGSEIYGQGEPSDLLYAIEFGCVRIGRITVDGRRQVCGFCLAGDVFGWESQSAHRFFAEAVGETGIRVLRPGRDHEASSKLLPLALETLTRFQQHLLVLGRTSVDERLAWFLRDLAERQGNRRHVTLPMQRSDISDHLGVSFETISRVLRRLKDQGVIRVPNTHSIDILDLEALEQIGGWERI